MTKVEQRAYPCQFVWEGSYYQLQAFVSDKWINADQQGSGFELISFVPNGEVYISGSFEPHQLEFIRLGVFKVTVEKDPLEG